MILRLGDPFFSLSAARRRMTKSEHGLPSRRGLDYPRKVQKSRLNEAVVKQVNLQGVKLLRAA